MSNGNSIVDIQIEIEPDFQHVIEEIREGVDGQVTEGMQYIADDAPQEMQLLMSDEPPSSKGSAPAKRTKTLFNSLQGKLTADGTVEIQMAGHAYYLDPIFEGLPDGGGYLERPFISIGIDTAVQKAFDRI